MLPTQWLSTAYLYSHILCRFRSIDDDTVEARDQWLLSMELSSKAKALDLCTGLHFVLCVVEWIAAPDAPRELGFDASIKYQRCRTATTCTIWRFSFVLAHLH